MNRYEICFVFDHHKIYLEVKAKNQAEALKEFTNKIGETYPEYAVIIRYLGKVS